MRVTNTLIVIAGAAFFMLAPFTGAQCPQTCQGETLHNTALGVDAWDSEAGSDNTAIGNYALQGVTGSLNTAVGSHAGWNISTGSYNTAVGAYTFGSLVLNSPGSYNTAIGYAALAGTNAGNNTAIGYATLVSDDQGDSNTASGANALFSNTNGNNNTATGYQALYTNNTGSNNTATGRGALYKNTASSNTATGYQALNKNTSGTYNTAQGYQALLNNTTASGNTATGYWALNKCTGNSNTAHGDVALYSNTNGNQNAALGLAALYSNTSGSNNIAVGSYAGFNLTTGSNNIDIGSFGVGGESATTRVGTVGTQTNTYIAGISGVTVAGGLGVIVDSNGHLGTMVSAARYKENIQPMDKASEAILSLQPVTFRYKKELDPQGIPQFGLVAEQVEKVDPELVARDSGGKPYSVRYEAVNAMLLNEFLKEHRTVAEEANKNREQEATIRELKSAVAEQQKEIKALSANLQRVSNQLELPKPAPRVVMNNP